MPTNQEIFNKVAFHLLSQNKKSRTKIECLYRGPDGLKCAIGCLIPDEDYSSKFEGYGLKRAEEWSELGEYFLKNNYTEENLYFMKELQLIHDTEDVESWKNCLSNLAIDFDLNNHII